MSWEDADLPKQVHGKKESLVIQINQIDITDAIHLDVQSG